MKEKGFTLIELIAVIVILSIISLIATPIILGIINNVKEESFKISTKSILKSVNLYSVQGEFENGRIKIICDGKICKHKENKIQINGEIPEGLIYVYENGTIDMQISNGTFCADKKTDTEIEITKGKCKNQDEVFVIPTVNKDSISVFVKTGYHVAKYYYSIDNENWVYTNHYVYTFENLELEKEYNIYIKLKLQDGTLTNTNVKTIKFTQNTLAADFLDYIVNENTGEAYLESEINSVEFLNISSEKIQECLNNKTCFDVSANQNSMVVAWVEPNEENNNLYNIYIGSNSVIYADMKTKTNNRIMSGVYSLFENYTNLTIVKFNNFFNVSNMSNLVQMFNECTKLESVDVSDFNTRNVEDISNMFSECTKLSELDLSKWDTQNLKEMYWVFADSNSLKELDLSNFDTSSVTSMTGMFRGCTNLETINLNNWNTKNVTNMNYMFVECKSLKELDLSSFDTSNVVGMEWMFKNARNLKTIYIGKKWKTSEKNKDMFLYCGTDKLTLKQ